MIPLLEIREKSREWSLREDVVEKDYVLGWLLWGIATDARIAAGWVFKGGTCLKKCYFETYRFSEDLDFTVVNDGPRSPETLTAIFREIAERVYHESGIEIPPDRIRFEAYGTSRGSTAVEGRIYYRGPRSPGGDLPRIKIDLTLDELLVQPAVNREIAHSYTDGLPGPPVVSSYSLAEVFGEKLRALAERTLPRDLYDTINIFRRDDLRGDPTLVREILTRKCQHRGLGTTRLASIEASPRRAELETEWENMLGHQLPQLPPVGTFFDDLRQLFEWLEGTVEPAAPLRPFPTLPIEEIPWAPPRSIASWPGGVPLESVRYAAQNRLCVDLRYGGSIRRIEPYALRRSKEGALLLYAIRRDNKEARSYRVDRIQGVAVSDESFTPTYPIELWPASNISVPPVSRRTGGATGSHPGRPRRSRPASGIRYVIQCSYCGKRFTRKSTTLSKHKMKGSSYTNCPGRSGFVVRPA